MRPFGSTLLAMGLFAGTLILAMSGHVVWGIVFAVLGVMIAAEHYE